MNTEPSTGTASYEGRHASEKLGYTRVQSTLIYAVEWDNALKFIENIGVDVTDSTNWGNHRNATFKYITASNTVATKGNDTYVLIPTGATERHMKQNISDMAGNMWEWTMEACSTSSRGFRGGTASYSGDDIPAAFRNGNEPTNSLKNMGFRIALYIK